MFIAGCALLLCLAAEKTFLGEVPPIPSPLHGLLVASTLVAYNLHALLNAPWVAGAALDRAWRRMHIGVAAVGAAVVVCLLPFVSPKIWIGLAVLGAFTAAYSTPLLPFKYKQRLKDFGLLKLGVLVGTWVLSTTWLPALKWDVSLHLLWPEIILRTALLLALCIAFDIRDVAPDRSAGILTLPVQIGVRRAYGIAYAALVAGILAAAVIPAVSRSSFLAVCITNGYAACAIAWSRARPSDAAYLIGVDGALAVYSITVLVG